MRMIIKPLFQRIRQYEDDNKAFISEDKAV